MTGNKDARTVAPEAGRLAATTRRRESITELLETAGQSLSAGVIADELLMRAGGKVGIEPASFLRNVQRDLVAMERLGKVRKMGDKWLVVEQDAGMLFESLTGAVALDLLLRTASWAIPEAILERLGDVRVAASKRLGNAFSGNPAVRWLKALRADEHPVFVLDRPVVDEDVRAAVEQAVMESRKIRLWTATTGNVFRGRTMGPWEISIGHYILRLPDMSAIGYWDRDGQYWEVGLEKFIRAEVMDEPAVLPFDPSITGVRPAGSSYATYVVEVLVDAYAMRTGWKNKEIGRRLKVLETYRDGAARCTFEAEFSNELVRFLAFYGAHVEVVWPKLLRDMVYEHGLALVAKYSSSNEPLQREAVAERRRLDCYLGD